MDSNDNYKNTDASMRGNGPPEYYQKMPAHQEQGEKHETDSEKDGELHKTTNKINSEGFLPTLDETNRHESAKDKYADFSKLSKPSPPPFDEMIETKRREREYETQLMVSKLNMNAHHHPLSSFRTDNPCNDIAADTRKSGADPKHEEMMETKRREREQGRKLSNWMSKRRPATISTPSMSSVDSSTVESQTTPIESIQLSDMLQVKRQERERVTSSIKFAKGRAPNLSSSINSTATSIIETSREQTPNDMLKHEDMMEEKRREREQGPKLMGASNMVVKRRFPLSTTVLSSTANKQKQPPAKLSNLEDMLEVKRREREQGPQLMGAPNMVSKRRSLQTNTAISSTVTSQKQPPAELSNLEDMLEVKRREREQGPQLMGASNMVVKRRPPPINTANSATATSQKQPPTELSNLEDMLEVKRREREQGPQLMGTSNMVVKRRPPPINTANSATATSQKQPPAELSNLEDMLQVKRREREQGPPLMGTSNLLVKRRSPPIKPTLLSSTANKKHPPTELSNLEDMLEVKRREREQRPQLVNASNIVVKGRPSSTTTTISSTAANEKQAPAELSNLEEILEVKRRECEQGPQLMDASNMVFKRRSRLITTSLSTTAPNPKQPPIELSNLEEMLEVKRREREQGPQLMSGSNRVVKRRPLQTAFANSSTATNHYQPPVELSNLEDLLEVKQREREHGPQLISGSNMVVKWRPPSTITANSSTAANQKQHSAELSNLEEMLEVKRREREQGPQLMGGSKMFVKRRRPPYTTASSSTATNPKQPPAELSNLEDMLEVKRRESEQGSHLMDASNIVAKRRPFSTDTKIASKEAHRKQPTAEKPNLKDMLEVKRREKEQGTQLMDRSDVVGKRRPPANTTANLSAVKNQEQPPAELSNLKDMLEVKRYEREQGPQLMVASDVVIKRRSPPTNTAKSSTAPNQNQPPAELSNLEDMLEVKWREREQGPQLIGASNMVAKRRPPPTNPANSATATSQKQSPAELSNLEDILAVKRREREQGPQLMGTSNMLVKRRPPLTTTANSSAVKNQEQPPAELSNLEDMLEVKRREREYGPQLMSTSNMFVKRRPPLTTTALSSPVPNPKQPPDSISSFDDVSESSLREEDCPPYAFFSSSCPFSTRTALNVDDFSKAVLRETESTRQFFVRDIANARRLSSTSTPTGEHVVSSKAEAGNVPASKMDSLLEEKRQERERGPQIISSIAAQNYPQHAEFSGVDRKPSAICEFGEMIDAVDSIEKQLKRETGVHSSGRRCLSDTSYTSGDSERDSGAHHKDPARFDEMAEVKRREREQGPQLIASFDATRNLSLSRAFATPGVVAVSSESYYSEKMMIQAKASTYQPAEDFGFSRVVTPDRQTYSLEIEESDEEDGGSEVTFESQAKITASSDHQSDDHVFEDQDEGNEDIFEAQAGIPIQFPGAFAIEGADARSDSSSTDYDSSSDQASYDSRDHMAGDGSSDVENAGALVAELHEEVVLDAQVILPQDEDDGIVLDSKAIRRLRFVQFSVVCFSLAAIVLVSISIIGGFSRKTFPEQYELKVEGWTQIGSVFGPTETPQTLFGSAVTISGIGTRLAVAAPGSNNETNFNSGEIYILEETIENGMEWTTVEVIPGLGNSRIPYMALSSSEDLSTLAAGYPYFNDGPRVIMYERHNDTWKQYSQSITAKPVLLENHIYLNETRDDTWFGYSLDLSADGSVLAVGALLTSSLNATDRGAVHIFVKEDLTGNWEELGGGILGEASNEYFGWAVKLALIDGKGDPVIRLAASTPLADDMTGLVRIFDWNGSIWVKVGEDLVGSGPFGFFGESISMSGDGSIVAVGARGSAFDAGKVEVFREGENGWTLSERDIISGKELGEAFGTSVILSTDGNTLAVGAPQNNAYGAGAGMIRMYRLDERTATWNEVGENIGGQKVGNLGVSLSLSADGSRVVGGAPSTSFADSVPRVGIVQIYEVNED